MNPVESTLGTTIEILRYLQQQPPMTVSTLNARVTRGERHGSWFIEFLWESNELYRSAEIALTNPSELPDSRAKSVVVTVRAFATSTSQWVGETIYEQQRAVSRLRLDDFEDWLELAVLRAANFTLSSLANAYTLPVERQST